MHRVPRCADALKHCCRAPPARRAHAAACPRTAAPAPWASRPPPHSAGAPTRQQARRPAPGARVRRPCAQRCFALQLTQQRSHRERRRLALSAATAQIGPGCHLTHLRRGKEGGPGLCGRGLAGAAGAGAAGAGAAGAGAAGAGAAGAGAAGPGAAGAGTGAARAHIVAAAGPRGRAGRRRRRSRRARSPARAVPALGARQRPGRLLLGACAPARVLSWSTPKAARLTCKRRQTAVGPGRGSAGSHAAAHWPCHCLSEGRGSPGAPTQSQGCTCSHASRLSRPQT